VNQSPAIGDRIRDVRKRRGLSQSELAALSGVSISLIRKLEQAERQDARLETLRKLAVALRVPTSGLTVAPELDHADQGTVDSWEPVRRALFSTVPPPDERPTADGVLAAMTAVRPALAANRYSEIVVILPSMIRDADALEGGARCVRSRVLNLTGWLLVQTRQWDSAEATLRLAIDSAADRLDAGAAANTMCWSLLRQGRLAEARELAIRWADDVEPRISRATTAELSLWGRFMLAVTNAAVRDARPGEAEDALGLARAAADRIGREVTADTSTARTFGPTTVAMISAENAAISGQPEKVLAMARGISQDVLNPAAAGRCRHRLDIASALAHLRRHHDAVVILEELRRDVPEWLVQQGYARDILSMIVSRRRILTPEMRELADFIRLGL
jgi:transcriptional regulator with XRE-family HTH domain